MLFIIVHQKMERKVQYNLYIPLGVTATPESPDFRTIHSSSDTRSGQPGHNGGNGFNFNKLTPNKTKMIEMLNMSIGSSPKDGHTT